MKNEDLIASNSVVNNVIKKIVYSIGPKILAPFCAREFEPVG